METDELVKSLEIYDKKYKRDEIDEILNKREEVTPHLISIFEKVLKNPEKYADRNSDYWGHIYAFMLLGHFSETKAHGLIVDLFSLPNELPSDLFGDSVTDGLSIVLLRTCGGNTKRIKDLILNKNADDYSRGPALRALSYALIEGYISREEILLFYGELFSEKQASPGSAFYNILASCIYDIYPEELMDTIKKAYDEELINFGYISYEEFIQRLNDSKEKCLDRLKNQIQKKQINNIHDAMSWWACFEQPKRFSPIQTSIETLKRQTKKKKTNNKSKKNQSKRARKANRKK